MIYMTAMENLLHSRILSSNVVDYIDFSFVTGVN